MYAIYVPLLVLISLAVCLPRKAACEWSLIFDLWFCGCLWTFFCAALFSILACAYLAAVAICKMIYQVNHNVSLSFPDIFFSLFLITPSSIAAIILQRVHSRSLLYQNLLKWDIRNGYVLTMARIRTEWPHFLHDQGEDRKRIQLESTVTDERRRRSIPRSCPAME